MQRIIIASMLFLSCAPSIADQGRQAGTVDCAFFGQESHDPDALVLDACVLDAASQGHDPVRIMVALRNGTDSDITFRPSFVFGAWLSAIIVGPQGDTVPSTVHVEPAITQPIVLPPGVFVGSTVDLRCEVVEQHGVEAPPSCVMPFAIDVPGEYTVTMIYTMACEEGMSCTVDAPRQTLFAKPFTIAVSSP